MSVYYVRKTGSDSNTGLDPGAAWLTIGKALGAAGISSGDTVYVGPGTYRENVTVAMTSAVAETFVIADVDGSRTGAGGEVRWTAYTTNDKTAPTTKALNLAGRDYLTFRNFVFVGGSAACVDANTTAGSTNVTFQDCTFFSGAGGAAVDRHIYWRNGAGGETGAWLVERCVFVGQCGAYIDIGDCTAGGADYSLDFVVRNCLFVGGADGDTGVATRAVVNCTGVGGGGAPGGVTLQNCTCLVGATAFLRTDANFSTSVPCYVKNCLTYSGLSAASSGQIVEDFNHIAAPVSRTNVSTGGDSETGNAYSSLFHVGQERQQGRLPKLFGSPTADSPLLGFGNDTLNPSALGTDFLSRPKPSGPGVTWGSAAKAIGYAELHDFGVSSLVPGGTNTTDRSVKVSGPGDIEFFIPVNRAPTTISVQVYRDSNYGFGTNPQIILMPNGELSVDGETVTDAGSDSVFNTLTLATFTPQKKGWVTVRLNSQSAATGITYWDTFVVTQGTPTVFKTFGIINNSALVTLITTRKRNV